MDPDRDAVTERLASLAEGLAVDLGDVATVRVTEERGAIVTTITPIRQGALPVQWSDFGDAIHVKAGHLGGEWCLIDRSLDQVDFIERITRSVIAGRVVETFGPGRSRVEVALPDGSRTAETGYEGSLSWLPFPGWYERGRRVEYVPYE